MVVSIHKSLGMLAAAMLCTHAHGGSFVGPDKNQVPLRRDNLPIAVDTMINLSQSFAKLAAGSPLENARDRRAVAKALALSLVLNPDNERANEILEKLVAGKLASKNREQDLAEEAALVWHIYGWLSSAEAGEEGNLLAELIGDTLVALDPKHPKAAKLKSAEEPDLWYGWVAPISAFRAKPTSPLVAKSTGAKTVLVDPFADTPEQAIKKPVASVEKPPEKTPPEKVISGFKLSEGKLGSVAFMKKSEALEESELIPLQLTMTAHPPMRSEWEDFYIRRVTGKGGKGRSDFPGESQIIRALQSIHGTLPKRSMVSIEIGERGKFRPAENGEDLTGPGFILANSALTGKPVAATVIAKLDESGQLVLPEFFWKDLTALVEGEGKGGRLVLPAAAREYLNGVLVLEKPEFFMKYEVLLAENREQFIEFCYQEAPESYADALNKFAEVRERGKDELVGAFVANKFVRQRLEEIASLAPYHLSAQLLAVQGAGKRPRTLKKKILASEIWRMIEPFDGIQPYNYQFRSVKRGEIDLESEQEILAENLESLERYTDRADEELLELGMDFAQVLRDLVRATKRLDYYQRETALSKAVREHSLLEKKIKQRLAELTGEPIIAPGS